MPLAFSQQKTPPSRGKTGYKPYLIKVTLQPLSLGGPFSFDEAGFLAYGSLYSLRLPESISGIFAAFITVHSCETAGESHPLPYYLSLTRKHLID